MLGRERDLPPVANRSVKLGKRKRGVKKELAFPIKLPYITPVKNSEENTMTSRLFEHRPHISKEELNRLGQMFALSTSTINTPRDQKKSPALFSHCCGSSPLGEIDRSGSVLGGDLCGLVAINQPLRRTNDNRSPGIGPSCNTHHAADSGEPPISRKDRGSRAIHRRDLDDPNAG